MDLETIKKHYRSLDDGKIKSVATLEARTLRPEVIPILREEIVRRNLPQTFLESLDDKILNPSDEQINDYCKIIQAYHCPDCKSKTAKLNGSISTDVLSVLFLTRKSKVLKIACPDCLDKHTNKAVTKTIFLGWWAFPWGPIRTIQAFMSNSKMAKQHHSQQPNDVLKSFVYENIGLIEAYKENEKRMNHFLQYYN